MRKALICIILLLLVLPALAGTKANILGRSGSLWILDKGEKDGVSVGMKGYFWTRVKAGGRWHNLNIARFRVVRVEKERCFVVVEELGRGFSEEDFQWAEFFEKLTPPEPVVQARKEEPTVSSTRSEQQPFLSVEKYLELAENAYEEGNYQLALQYYRKVLEIDPTDPGAKAGIERTKRKLEQVREMERLRKLKERVASYLKRAGIYEKRGELKIALLYYFRAYKIYPEEEIINKIAAIYKNNKELVEEAARESNVEPNKIIPLLEIRLIKEPSLKDYLRLKSKLQGSPYLSELKKKILQRYRELPPESWWDKIVKNSKGYWEAEHENGHVMVWIPQLKIWADKYEVSNAQYLNYCSKAGKKPRTVKFGQEDYTRNKPNYPALLPYEEAASYCRFFGMRLPTEQEWEFLWGEGKYPWGSAEPDEGGTYRANYETLKDGFDGPAPVRSFESFSSLFGIVNLAGNVWEWVEGKAAKGGGFLSFKDRLLKSSRITPSPADVIGFRCVKGGRK